MTYYIISTKDGSQYLYGIYDPIEPIILTKHLQMALPFNSFEVAQTWIDRFGLLLELCIGEVTVRPVIRLEQSDVPLNEHKTGRK